ncbi:MAG: KpsF/GutQ family sugar-phosphate isomerase [Euryarchaeota archaeon]|nr:KpsF/GutQ family sugar-phosphate isomerase [Euryarchaeota archaeon]
MKKTNHKPRSVLTIARSVLRIEGRSILDLIPGLGAEFEAAVKLLESCRGKVIVTGMGKTGLIGRKISATLASTGTPSLSLHPAEALHGDLGMIGLEDIVLAISNSGESAELKALIPVIKRMGLRLISIAGQNDSTLARYSDVVIDASVKKEACPHNLVPTASTTAALALGDALAVALLEKRGFKPSDFARLHPAGSLGRRLLLKVSDLMREGESNPVVREDTPVKEVLCRITTARAGAASVVDERGKLTGIFTDGDLRRHLERSADLLNQPVKKVMTARPLCVSKEKLAVEALRLLGGRRVDELPVVNRKKEPVGMLDVQDLLSAGLS